MTTPRTQKPQISNNLRNSIINKHSKGKSIIFISNELDLPYKTLYSIISLYKKTGRIEARPTRSGRTKIINQEISDLIKEKINDNVSITLKSIQKCLLEEKNIIASLFTIDRSIASFNFSFTKIQFIPEARNSETNIQKRFDYANFYLAQDEDKIIFLYEFGCSCSIRSMYGRGELGTTQEKTYVQYALKNTLFLRQFLKKSYYL
jgi:transposase